MENIHLFLKLNVHAGAKLMIETYGSYNGLQGVYKHQTVNHNDKEYVNGEIHTNGCENFWSLLKRSIIGIYHSVFPQHLLRYCNEFEYRYNTRGRKDVARFSLVLKRVEGKLTYKQLIGK